MRSDLTDVASLVSYINDIKPFHTKLTEVAVEYQANENVGVRIVEGHLFGMEFSSVWEIHAVSDGVRTRYRIPAALFPRYSDDFHQSIRTPVTDAIPGFPNTYAVPFNDALEVFVNDVMVFGGTSYFISTDRTRVTFIGDTKPGEGDVIRFNWAVMDRVFIGLGTDAITWQSYNVKYFSEYETFDKLGYDTDLFDDYSKGLFFTGEQDELYIDPLGVVRVEQDIVTGGDYYVFDFFKPQPLNTQVWIRVEQREAYNGWTQTSITETIDFAEMYFFDDNIYAEIVDPGTWTINPDKYGQQSINPDQYGYYDIDRFDIAPTGYDSGLIQNELGYFKLFNINLQPNTNVQTHLDETQKFDIQTTLQAGTIAAHVSDSNIISLSDNYVGSVSVTTTEGRTIDYASNPSSDNPRANINDVVVIEITQDGITYQVTTPDASGTVYITKPSAIVQIGHSLGYNPLVVVYMDGAMISPQSITYPNTNTVEVRFATPRSVVIRLV